MFIRFDAMPACDIQPASQPRRRSKDPAYYVARVKTENKKTKTLSSQPKAQDEMREDQHSCR